MKRAETNIDAETLGLSALAWLLSEDRLADRLLAITGETPEGLRARLGETDLLAAALAFLEGHEPDLLACAAALEVDPAALVAARRSLES